MTFAVVKSCQAGYPMTFLCERPAKNINSGFMVEGWESFTHAVMKIPVQIILSTIVLFEIPDFWASSRSDHAATPPPYGPFGRRVARRHSSEGSTVPQRSGWKSPRTQLPVEYQHCVFSNRHSIPMQGGRR